MADEEGLPHQLRRARAAAQLLADSKKRTPAAIVRHLLAVQAQDFASMPLALRARSRGLKREAVFDALNRGELVISWLNRGTLHLVHRDDYPWLLSLTAPTTRTANKRRLAEEGVKNPARAVRAIVKALDTGPLLRSQIGETVGLAGGALTHALLAASLDGVVIRGPVTGKEQTFILVRDHLGELEPVDRDVAMRQLARRYARAHALATEADLAYWSGLPRRAVPQIEGLTDRHTGDASVRLLPAFDPYIIDWKDRSFVLPAEYAKRVMPGGGMFRAVVLVDGQAAGTWSRAGGRVAINWFAEEYDVGDEVAGVERFLS